MKRSQRASARDRGLLTFRNEVGIHWRLAQASGEDSRTGRQIGVGGKDVRHGIGIRVVHSEMGEVQINSFPQSFLRWLVSDCLHVGKATIYEFSRPEIGANYERDIVESYFHRRCSIRRRRVRRYICQLSLGKYVQVSCSKRRPRIL